MRRLAVAAAFVAAVTGCAGRGAEATLRAELAVAVERGTGAKIDLATAMPIEWDVVQVITPYTRPAEVDSLLGFLWDSYPIGRVLDSDLENALLFVRGRRVVRAIVIERSLGDFCCWERNGQYRRERARFEVVVENGGPRLRHVR